MQSDEKIFRKTTLTAIAVLGLVIFVNVSDYDPVNVGSNECAKYSALGKMDARKDQIDGYFQKGRMPEQYFSLVDHLFQNE